MTRLHWLPSRCHVRGSDRVDSDETQVGADYYGGLTGLVIV